jgi:pseudouridine-5'-phosphate glycosidase
VLGLLLVGHRYDRSVTRYPAPFVNMAREVRDTLVRGGPVVALETTYVSHGFPHPTGVETAIASEESVRAAGAVPATIALMDGEIKVGMRPEDLERIALEHPRKVSPRDLAATLADGALGATTVAGTIAIARLCGIHHAATGGIGGVHRDAERTFDISADLTELARAQVCLVCSGAKSILDVPRTLEVLETLGIPVVGFGTSTLPLFYCRESEHEVPARVDTADQAAALCRIHWELGATAVLVTNPPPAESALSREDADALIDAGLAAATKAGITGQAVTPYVLAHIHEASGGPSERVNRELIVANAGVAGAIAAAAARG